MLAPPASADGSGTTTFTVNGESAHTARHGETVYVTSVVETNNSTVWRDYAYCVTMDGVCLNLLSEGKRDYLNTSKLNATHSTIHENITIDAFVPGGWNLIYVVYTLNETEDAVQATLGSTSRLIVASQETSHGSEWSKSDTLIVIALLVVILTVVLMFTRWPV